MTYQCQNCGAPLTVSSGEKIVKCEYCDSFIRISESRKDERIDALFQHACNVLSDHNFDQAAICYRQILDIAPHEHRAYWGLVLCKLECVNDNAFASLTAAERMIQKNNGNSIFYPSATEVEKSILAELNPEYQNALRYAPEPERAHYQDCFNKLKRNVLTKSTNKVLDVRKRLEKNRQREETKFLKRKSSARKTSLILIFSLLLWTIALMFITDSGTKIWFTILFFTIYNFIIIRKIRDSNALGCLVWLANFFLLTVLSASLSASMDGFATAFITVLIFMGVPLFGAAVLTIACYIGSRQ